YAVEILSPMRSGQCGIYYATIREEDGVNEEV
ncbi:unnamed protein product, partial [marine sediment metagenome]